MVAWISRNSLLETGAISEVQVTAKFFFIISFSKKLASFCFWFRRKTTLWRKVYLIIRNSFRGFIHNQVSVGVQWLSKHLIWVLYFKFTDLWIHLKKKIFVNDFLVIYFFMSSRIYLGFFCFILWQKFFVSSVKASIILKLFSVYISYSCD